MSILTKAERDTLNAAADIIRKHTAYGASWQIGFQHWLSSGPSFDIAYFDTNKEQHGWVKGSTFADKVQTVCDIEATVGERRVEYKTARIEALRKELAELEARQVAA